EYFTIAWNALEGLVAIVAGAIAGSISLVGFGIDSFIEVTTGSVLLLAGLLLNALSGWWWADPAAALIMVPIIAKEGFEGLQGKACDDCGSCAASVIRSSLVGEKVRRERRWTSAGETPARELVRSTR